MSALLRRAAAALLLAAAAALPARAEITITPVTSPGGLSAWLYEDHTIPMVTLESSFLGGAALFRFRVGDKLGTGEPLVGLFQSRLRLRDLAGGARCPHLSAGRGLSAVRAGRAHQTRFMRSP